ncbi:MAG: GNAT family N-acetyltransferase [Clostridia bacterium]|nr:GNAT family N-acetyltransferase [Clostridia bacterium]
MTEYRFARLGEEEAILDHINLVFSQAHEPHHFDRLIPKVYGHAGHAPLHAIALEDGHIRAAIGLLPMELMMDGKHILKLGFVGSVSVHERYRGRGYMKKLMEMIVARGKELGCDFLALGGQRQRYGYWGFECGGCSLRFEITRANIRHALKEVDGTAIRIRRIEDEKDAALDAAYALYERQPMLCRRSREDFLTIMRTWNHDLFALEKEGRLIGYYCGEEGWIGELALLDEGDLLPLIKAWMGERKSGAVSVPAHMQGRARALKAFAEEYSIQDRDMFRIYNWPRVLSAALEVKHGFAPLMDGRMTFEIEGEGKFTLSLENGKAGVTQTEDAPEMRMTPNQAVEFFFSPFSAFYAPDGLMKCWLPLPLGIPSADAF